MPFRFPCNPVFDFYVYVNMFYGSISDFCTDRDCPIMSAGPGFEYPLLDGQKKASKPTAPQYILVALSSIQDLINDENVFPTKDGNEFPATFRQNVKTIFKQLMRIFAHMYHSHFDKMLPLYQEGHLNSLFAHFVRFAREFDLLEKKDMLPMQELVDFFGNEGILN
ncbi:MOB kinase activator 1B [Lunasporangiospora selenospora]|uniref:MOB kinase activator 1B n=1 Tax=Lunasporangiospora selenospora TaxID=979761 RepID=A0A9P6FYF5_9FUNG|nr:MOB kinase activator 1B [Lunasporangiospora selenospora]